MIISPTMLLALFALQFTATTSSIREGVQQHRQAQKDDAVVRDFVPLSCNNDLSPCTSFAAAFGPDPVYMDRLVIPCGTCYTMDHAADSLFIMGGLEIRGKLVFPEDYQLRVILPFVVVQGELVINAEEKPINGEVNVEFLLAGDDTYQSFEPIDENAEACKGEETCTIGKKAFVVAGGSVDMRGISSNTPTWTRLYDVHGEDTIVLDNSVEGKWMPGAEILITSHTTKYDGHQVRTIESVKKSSTEGYVELQLNEEIVRPTTMLDSRDFAVEVALLSRNIQFRGLSDPNPSHGGHFQVFHTPNVPQTVQGIDFVNFGQQGKLGYYPIHFHFCGNSPNSMVFKNTIRESNQRCVVVHGTNQLRVESNVAFDTKGHCFITEDGMEVRNEFKFNLGALTGIPDEIIPDNGFNGEESDGEPATFWITNPNNKFVGNVAAGSLGAGFWYELRLRGEQAHLYPDLDPKYVKLGVFSGNIAHSNEGKTGAIRLYDPGFLPNRMAYLKRIKSYRNKIGIFIHKNYNLVVQDSLFADNGVGMDIDRAEGIAVRNVKIIGMSDNYKKLRKEQRVPLVCYRRRVTGVDLHTWTIFKGYGGTIFDDIEFSGFSDTLCQETYTINMDDHNIEQGLFEHFSSFSNIDIGQDGLSKVNFCDLVENDIDTVYLTDRDGSLGLVPTTSTLMSFGDRMEAFVDQSKCTRYEDRCFQYCEDTCFRSMRYEIEGRHTEKFVLRVCSTEDKKNCAMFSDSRRFNPNPRAADEPRTFIAHVPVGGTYEGTFFTNTGDVYTPTDLNVYQEESHCPSGMGVFDITIDGFTDPPIVFQP